MTREQKIDICTMRIDGRTLPYIAEKYGVSKQYIHQLLNSIASGRDNVIKTQVAYPRIRVEMENQNINVSKLAKLSGVSYCTVLGAITKTRECRMNTYAKIANGLGISLSEMLEE